MKLSSRMILFCRRESLTGASFGGVGWKEGKKGGKGRSGAGVAGVLLLLREMERGSAAAQNHSNTVNRPCKKKKHLMGVFFDGNNLLPSYKATLLLLWWALFCCLYGFYFSQAGSSSSKILRINNAPLLLIQRSLSSEKPTRTRFLGFSTPF